MKDTTKIVLTAGVSLIFGGLIGAMVTRFNDFLDEDEDSDDTFNTNPIGAMGMNMNMPSGMYSTDDIFGSSSDKFCAEKSFNKKESDDNDEEWFSDEDAFLR